jgi:hypothetical protein
MKKKYFLFLLIFCGGVSLHAQQSPIMIVDLFARPVFIIDSLGKMDTTNFKILLSFKISKSDSTDKVYIFFGSAKDSSDILYQEASKVSANGKNSLSYNNGTPEPFTVNIESRHLYPFTLSQWRAVKWITVYLKDLQGLYSQREYFGK